MSNIKISELQLIEWNDNRLYNPLTKRKIKETGFIFKKIKKMYDQKTRD